MDELGLELAGVNNAYHAVGNDIRNVDMYGSCPLTWQIGT